MQLVYYFLGIIWILLKLIINLCGKYALLWVLHGFPSLLLNLSRKDYGLQKKIKLPIDL